jgi:hypothetical protein
MKRTVFIPILLFSLSIAVSAFEVRGTVLTPGGKPIEGAVILHRSSTARVLSDSGGAFTLDVPDEDRVRLEVIHPDYYEQAFAFTKKTAARGVTLILAPLISQKEEVVVTALRYPEASANVPAAGTVIGNAALTEEMAPRPCSNPDGALTSGSSSRFDPAHFTSSMACFDRQLDIDSCIETWDILGLGEDGRS